MRDRIFFEDEVGKISGPFSERQTQEGYRKGWFDQKRVLFYFTSCDTHPDAESDDKFDLPELQTRNGRACPFKWIDRSMKTPGEIREGLRKQLKCIEEEMETLRVDCEAVAEMEKIIERMEKQIEEVCAGEVSAASERSCGKEKKETAAATETAAAAESNAASAAAAPKLQREKPVVRKWTGLFTDFYARILEHLRLGEDPKIEVCTELFQTVEINITDAHASEDHWSHLFYALRLRISELPCRYCAFCDRFSFTPRHMIMHIASNEHARKVFAAFKSYLHVNTLLTKIVSVFFVSELFSAATAKEKAQREKWSSISLSDAKLRPTRAFLDQLSRKYGKDLTPNSQKLRARGLFAPKAFELAKGEMGARLMTELEEHFSLGGEAKTRCLSCQMVTGTKEDFYEHVLSFRHVRVADGFDLVTLAVNAQLRPLREAWPAPPGPAPFDLAAIFGRPAVMPDRPGRRLLDAYQTPD